jgi:hypothetical protein
VNINIGVKGAVKFFIKIVINERKQTISAIIMTTIVKTDFLTVFSILYQICCLPCKKR